MLGTGFGRRTRSEYVTEAVLIAKQMPGTPIKLLKSREEDMTNGVYHPVTQCKLTGALDKDDNLVGLHMRISGQSILAYARPEAMQGGADPATFQGLNPGGAEGAFGYDIPNLLIDHAMRNPHVPPWFWRGVNNNQNAIYLECFMDELAHAAGQDPLAFRRKMMAKHPKHLAVLNAVAEKVGWDKPAPQGIFRGICQHMGYGSYVAAAAEVSVTRQQGQDAPHRRGDQFRSRGQSGADRAADRRLVRVRPVGAVPRRHHRSRTAPWSRRTSTPTARSAWPRCRRSKSIIMPTDDFWGGVGEPTIFVAAPAVLNAIFAATGQAHPLVPAEEPEPADRLTIATRSGGPKPPHAFDADGSRDAEARRPASVLQLSAAGAAAMLRAAMAQGAGRVVVVIGGGFGGANCARALAQGRSAHRGHAGRGQPTYTAPPHEQRRPRRPDRHQAPAVRLRPGQGATASTS